MLQKIFSRFKEQVCCPETQPSSWHFFLKYIYSSSSSSTQFMSHLASGVLWKWKGGADVEVEAEVLPLAVQHQAGRKPSTALGRQVRVFVTHFQLISELWISFGSMIRENKWCCFHLKSTQTNTIWILPLPAFGPHVELEVVRSAIETTFTSPYASELAC